MTQNDPTDHALAAIASILDNKDKDTFALKDSDVEHGSVTLMTETVVTETVSVMISTQPEMIEDQAGEPEITKPETAVIAHESPSTVPEPVDVDGYMRVGPGPLDAIRFRWTARRDDDGLYFVDETIGSSRAISAGPMAREEIIDFIDNRERAARDRFETLKSQMTAGSARRVHSD